MSWITLALYWLDFPPGWREGFGEPVTAETVWATAVGTALAAAVTGVLYWLGTWWLGED